MPYGSVRLIPGVNVERTPTLNQTGFSASQLVRFKDGLVQKYGGWQSYYQFAVATVPRALHGWTDLSGIDNLAIGATTALQVITSGLNRTVTPQRLVSDFSPDFTTTIGTPTVEITDPNITNVTTYDAIYFNTPVSVGGLILSGFYKIVSITGAHSFTITATKNATSSVSSGGSVPQFTTTNGTAFVKVTLTAHGLSTGQVVSFGTTTTGNGVTIFGSYDVAIVLDANNFQIVVATAATATGSFNMNGGNAELVYYIQVGPAAPGVGYGLGLYGAGLYGYGTGSSSSQTGTAITATDWTLDNWGKFLIACPEGGGVYFYDPTGGFTNAGVVSTAPPFNTGLFVSTTQQILVCYGSSVQQDVGWSRDPMWVAWSNVGDFTDFTPTSANQAGGFRIPIGSEIRAGMAVANQNLIWTDLDLWAMTYVGYPNTFGFNKIGAGAGAVGKHAAQSLRGGVYWMGNNNFFRYLGGSVEVIPCPVWDAVFQNINTAFIQNVRAMPNTPFNEVGWLYPSLASTSGECDSYVKFNITEQGMPWDIGSLSRSAWIDAGALGMPISATTLGALYSQETTANAAGAPITASFQTGFFYLGEGEDFVAVDQILPDFKWATYPGGSSASIQITFSVADWPDETPRVYGPYTVTSATEQLSVRFRGRLMAISVASSDLGSFWRLGLVKYRYAPMGRR